MDNLDAVTFSLLALKLGLITEAQRRETLEEAQDEAGGRNPDLQTLVRVLERKRYLTPWQRGKILKGDVDGFILGGYRLLYKIASGSFGRVFRADDSRAGRVVAVKVLRRRWSEDEQRIELFFREGRLGMTLKHPNIVEVLAVDQDRSSGQYYIVMEFVEGGNLREILQIRKRLTVAESLRILEDCTSALVYAFNHGMTHRDVKLTNILISSTGEAKLVDFGLAYILTHGAKEEEKVDRTVDYAGLERATGVEPGDPRSDIFFLGCVFYEALTGRPPLLMTRDRHARMRKGRFENLPPIHPSEIDAPPSVFALAETMMSLSPQRRYQTLAQLLEAVRAARREVDGKTGRGGAAPAKSVFVAESDERLQDQIRDGLKELNYRVFIASDPLRAVDRFRQQPYDALVVDAETTGEEGVLVFANLMREAARRHAPLAGVLILAAEQAGWAERVQPAPNIAVMVRPGVTLKRLQRKLQELLAAREQLRARQAQGVE